MFCYDPYPWAWAGFWRGLSATSERRSKRDTTRVASVEWRQIDTATPPLAGPRLIRLRSKIAFGVREYLISIHTRATLCNTHCKQQNMLHYMLRTLRHDIFNCSTTDSSTPIGPTTAHVRSARHAGRRPHAVLSLTAVVLQNPDGRSGMMPSDVTSTTCRQMPSTRSRPRSSCWVGASSLIPATTAEIIAPEDDYKIIEWDKTHNNTDTDINTP